MTSKHTISYYMMVPGSNSEVSVLIQRIDAAEAVAVAWEAAIASCSCCCFEISQKIMSE